MPTLEQIQRESHPQPVSRLSFRCDSTALSDCLRMRAGLPAARQYTPEQEAELRGLSFVGLAKEELIARCRLMPPLESDIIRSALDSGALGDALSGTMAAAVVDGTNAESDSTAGWVAPMSVKNFAESSVYSINRAGKMEPLARGDIAREAALNVGESRWRLARYAVKLSVDEMDFLDDQVGIFLGFLRELSRAAARLRRDLVYSEILANPLLDSDGLAAFCTDHGNYGSGVGSTLAAGLAAGLSAIQSQMYVDASGNLIHPNYWPRYLIVPPSLELTARTAARNLDTTGSPGLIVRVESRLSALGFADPMTGEKVVGSDTCWMLACDAKDAPSILIGELDGAPGPTVSRQVDRQMGKFSETWSLKADCAVKIVGYRGLYFSAGA